MTESSQNRLRNGRVMVTSVCTQCDSCLDLILVADIPVNMSYVCQYIR